MILMFVLLFQARLLSEKKRIVSLFFCFVVLNGEIISMGFDSATVFFPVAFNFLSRK